MNDSIVITNASIHNLKNVSLAIPKNRIVAFTGVSGSGKSSLVFDTIYTEAQRQLIETFSSFARARLPKLSRPPVDEIRNISTAIVIDQKRMGVNLRSTVGTATEISTYLRLLFSRCGDPFIGPSFMFGFNHPQGMCPDCQGIGQVIAMDVDRLIRWDKSIREGAVDHPDYRVGGWLWREIMAMDLFPVDTPLRDFSEPDRQRFLHAEGIPVERRHGAGIYTKNFEGVARKLQRLHLSRPAEQLNQSRRSAYEKYFTQKECPGCGGDRISPQARSVRLNGRNIAELSRLELAELDGFLSGVDGDVARPLVAKARRILAHLIEIGVGYLSLNRPVSTLSGGESQRVKMARQLDCDLVDMMYILDEPSIGLHPRDIGQLLDMLRQLKDKGNTVLVVEHDPAVMACAEHVVDIGPGAGSLGGEIVFSGTLADLKRQEHNLTARYLRKREPARRERKKWTAAIEIRGATLHNLKNVSTRIPRGVLTCVTGVAGSGKSSLINDFFLAGNRDAVIVDQSPVGRSSRSNPLTYIGAFEAVRREFARAAGRPASLFSFNSRGACPKCKGLGAIAVEMSFLDEVKIVCDECQGKRYTEEVLALAVKGRNIHDVLRMTAREALGYFDDREIRRKLQVLCEVGLDYLELGQPLSTLSGGECQRIKLASELHKKGRVYVMDEPTTGLHMADIDKLLGIIRDLVKKDNTVIVIEHNLDVISQADWVIDLGPEGGSRGGEIVFEGTPEDLVKCGKGHTGRYLNDFYQGR
ncbi:MAG TPA: excinuclease ABC subunit UvrA [Candidatus Aminicenantes bacterium]|nr:excinuclease ABC subunit UvrA [Candidatus Aminicenantes bacterium]